MWDILYIPATVACMWTAAFSIGYMLPEAIADYEMESPFITATRAVVAIVSFVVTFGLMAFCFAKSISFLESLF